MSGKSARLRSHRPVHGHPQKSNSPLTVKDVRARASLIDALFALPYLDAEQSAVVLDTHAATIRRMCLNGTLPHVRVGTKGRGKLIRINTEDLRAWMRGSTPPKKVAAA